MQPILINFGNYEAGSYGVFLGAAALLSLWVARSLGKRDGLEPRRVNDLGLSMIVCGILGSKLLGVVVALLSGAPLEWSELRNAGAVHGGLMVGGLTGFLLARRFKLPLQLLLDAYAPAAAVGQAVGRLGCFAAGCCFGTPSNAPWAVSFSDPKALALGGVPLHTDLHPVQLYDAGLHGCLFLVLWFLHRRGILRGRLFGVWCISEGVLRALIETFRGDLGRGVWFDLSFLSTGRVTALAIASVGVVFLWLTARVPAAPSSPVADAP